MAASVFGWLTIQAGAADVFLDLIRSAGQGPMVTLIILNLILLVMGMFIEATSMIILLSPILVPLIRETGIDPVHFGIIMVVNAEIGMLTPPVGLNLYVASGISRLGLTTLSRAVMPWLATMLAFLMIVTFWPDLSLALPRWLGMH